MKKKLVIITGISGAGKNTALSIFESQGYFCTDNLPGLLVEDFLRIIEEKEIDKTAISIDIRSKHLHVDLKELLGAINLDKKKMGNDLNLIILKEIGNSKIYKTTTSFFS